MIFWVVIVIAAFVVSFLLESDTGKYVLTAGVGALACLLIYWITDWGIMLTLAKLCGVGIILIAAFVVISAIFGK